MATKAYLDVAGTVVRRHRLWLGFLAVAVILAAATAWTYGRLDRYQPDGRSWLPEPPFAGWEVEGRTEGIVIDGTTVRVINADPDGGTGLRWLLHRAAGDAAAFEVSATVWTEGLSGGRPRWHGGRVTIAEIGQGKRAGDPSRGRNIELANLQRDKVPAVYRKLFTFGSDTPRVELAIRLYYATGTIGVSDLVVTGYEERPAFRLAADALRVAWAVLFLAGLVLVLRNVKGSRPRLALAALAVTGAVIILMPHSLRETIAQTLSRTLLRGAVSPETAARIGHFWLFAALALVTRLLRPRDRLWVQVLGLVLLAGASELAQLMADGRNPSLLDWGADCLGVGLGLTLAWLVPKGRLADGPGREA
jgi:hypothetical protein